MDELELIERYCCQNELGTYDPYDIWKTAVGVRIKGTYHHNPKWGSAPAFALAIYDHFVNNRRRFGYQKLEYPIVRALAALSLMNAYRSRTRWEYLEFARVHLDWLVGHPCSGYHGPCWGLGFEWPVARDLTYGANAPLTTATPYPLEALDAYTRLSGDERYVPTIRKIFDYYDSDVKVLRDDSSSMAVSYGPNRDRVVTNATAYTLYAYAVLSTYLDGGLRRKAEVATRKCFEYLRTTQMPDGGWLYAEADNPFIDCFHTCIVLKNLVKTSRRCFLDGWDDVVAAGYAFLNRSMWDSKRGLFRRFARANKPSLIKYDLYDNAEAMSLAILLGDDTLAERLAAAIESNFVQGQKIYSVIDLAGIRRNEGMLRWAIMPYMYALSLKIAFVRKA